jgi:hypothetical protein
MLSLGIDCSCWEQGALPVGKKLKGAIANAVLTLISVVLSYAVWKLFFSGWCLPISH